MTDKIATHKYQPLGELAVGDEKPTNCLMCGLGENNVVHLNEIKRHPYQPLLKSGSTICRVCGVIEDAAQHQGFRQRPGDQRLPDEVEGPIAHEEVKKDLDDRLALGIERYGQPLRPLNGRDTLKDVYEETLDQVVYLKTLMLERHAMARLLFFDPPEGMTRDEAEDKILDWLGGVPDAT